MKKMIFMMVAAFALAAYCPTTAQAQSYEAKTNKLLEKQLKKEYKDKLKELKKEKWQLYGSSHTLEVALLTHYDKLAKGGEDAHEVVGTATKFKSKNIGHQTAINNACNIYARQAGSHVKGRIVSDMGANSDSIVNEFDHFYGAYQSLVEKEIKGEMQESFSLIRPYKDGSYEMQTFFIINENAASKARLRAFEIASKESAIAQKYAEKVGEFIKEGFATE